ncbi:AAA family ATPase [Cordyceps militaris CM01]|uniref:AAA family ATPase n=1 Tax=Cordyceps militaris (strain CM01) TaxID=983644 RepID=G3JPR0_CORMM|nr:AAA family ATPase [Cordyceps militaris CM01]EGX89161.1 AAA family ATPase [Cordyceps militaris CM01]
MTFKPGELLFTGPDCTKTGRILEVTSTEFHEASWAFFQGSGFALVEKLWCWFRVDQVADVAWDAEAAFDQLMEQDDEANGDSDGSDDLIRGKRKRCVLLSYGPPGIGKTFTVQSIAEVAKRPLYRCRGSWEPTWRRWSGT